MKCTAADDGVILGLSPAIQNRPGTTVRDQRRRGVAGERAQVIQNLSPTLADGEVLVEFVHEAAGRANDIRVSVVVAWQVFEKMNGCGQNVCVAQSPQTGRDPTRMRAASIRRVPEIGQRIFEPALM